MLAGVLLGMLTAAFCVRAWRYEQIAKDLTGRQAAVFASLHPGSPVPTGVVTRLESDLRRLTGTTGSGKDVPDRPSCLDTLREVAEALAKAPRSRVTQFTMDGQGVLVEGETLSHGDAEEIARRLTACGLTAEPPRTEKLPANGVSFALAAKRSGAVGDQGGSDR